MKLLKSFKIMSLVVQIISFGVFLIPVKEALADGNFSNSCTNISLEARDYSNTAILRADCKRRNQSVNKASINLNDYIINNDGRLAWQNRGGFQQSCKNSVGVTTIYSFCKKRDGNLNLGFLNLNERIANIDGELKYIP
ncbi:CVNH domain-containing protein [Nostoc sp. ChiVER01]|uniref:mannose-binding lectin n=1 Tax=Nostoc sp. ChiVER01 TaxID=3075382 RepID=UPI002AD370B5|nr:CVNH domain-containing protein [Nostoc sp. ChiVER01]MDZ8227940.1 CVNH domain-containing protein [Nostoc sp. ChiVER01]